MSLCNLLNLKSKCHRSGWTMLVASHLAAFALLVLLLPPSAHAQGPVAIFSPAGQGDLSFEGVSRLRVQDPTIIRSRLVSVNMVPLKSPDMPAGEAGAILNLFDDVVLVAVKDRLSIDSLGVQVWEGRVKDVPAGVVVMAMQGDQMAANITLPGRIFQVRAVEGGVHEIREIDQSKFKECAGPLLPSDPQADDLSGVPATSHDNREADSIHPINLDVLVVISKQAAEASANINTEMSLARTETNTAYTNSNAHLAINVVKILETAYDDSGDLDTDLDRLTGTIDGFLDNVHGLRDQLGADLVVFIVEDGGDYCGLAWMPDPPTPSHSSIGFSVVVRSCATGYYSFGHEIGHNLGLHHDCYVDNEGSPLSHGYVDTANQWRTIMAYPNECTDADTTCQRIQRFSNPLVNYLGAPTGETDSAYGSCNSDNKSVLESNGLTVADWRKRSGGLAFLELLLQDTASPIASGWASGATPWATPWDAFFPGMQSIDVSFASNGFQLGDMNGLAAYYSAIK